ncbi:MAG: hypothetical protein P1V51_22280 [Deltaproteobacteria bacterium]|nr:hypothetical protein [Deltaproteobacteria bacterium]
MPLARSLLTAQSTLLLLGAGACGGTEPPRTYQHADAGVGLPLPEEAGTRVFALEQVSSEIVTNPSPFSNDTAVSSLTAWLRVRWSREGEEIVWDEALCAMRSNEIFGTTTRYPQAFLESIPRRQRSGRLAAAQVGATFEAGPFVDLFGVRLTDPASEALPTGPDDPRVEDSDGDGEPGITVAVEQSLLGSGEVFVAQRSTSSYEGVVVSPDRLEGEVRVITEKTVLGATAGWLESGTEAAPDPDPTHNYFIFQAVPDHTTCTQIVLNRDRIFDEG